MLQNKFVVVTEDWCYPREEQVQKIFLTENALYHGNPDFGVILSQLNVPMNTDITLHPSRTLFALVGGKILPI